MANIPVAVPLFTPLYEKSERRIDEFLSSLYREFKEQLPLQFAYARKSGTSGSPTPQNDERLLAYAYLRSRHWSVEKALAMVRGTLSFRETHQLDALQVHPSPISLRGYNEQDLCTALGLPLRTVAREKEKMAATMSECLHYGFHFWDRRCIPVVYWLLGKVDVRGTIRKLKQITPVGQQMKDISAASVAYGVEVGWNLCRYQNLRLQNGPLPGTEKPEGRLQMVTIVVDAGGLGYKKLWRPALELLQDNLRTLQKYYADSVNRILVVNCPVMIMFAYDIIKSSLNQGLREKIAFVKPCDTALALDRVIGMERVPSFLGGTCNCPGGCIASYEPRSVLHAEEDGEGDAVTQEIVLKPGMKLERAFELVAGEEVVWEFVSTSGADVRFLVLFYPKTDGISVDPQKQCIVIDKEVKKAATTSMEQRLVQQSKLSDGSDCFCATQDGVLQLLWDNSSSWTQKKPIQMRIFKNAPVDDASA